MENKKSSSKILNLLSVIVAVVLALFGLINSVISIFTCVIFLLSAVVVSPISKKIFKKIPNSQLRLLRVSVPILMFLGWSIIGVISDEIEQNEIDNQGRELVKKYLKENNDLYFLKQADSLYFLHNYFEGAYEHDEDLDYLQNLLKETYATGIVYDNNNAFESKFDTINQKTTVDFYPEFLTDELSVEFQNVSKENAIKKFYLQFIISDKQNIESIRSVIQYYNGQTKYKDLNNNDFIVANYLNKKKIQSQRGYIEARVRYAEHDKLTKRFESDCLSPYSGGHIKLIELVKEGMNNPSSFEHVDTKYKIQKSDVIVVMKFRGTNAFNAIVTNSVTAKIDIATCKVLEVK